MIINYTIPESKKDITLKRYLKVIRLYKEAEKQEREVNEKEVISACLNLPIKVIDKIPFHEYEEIVQGITESLGSESVLHLTFDLDGVKYGFINDFENMSAGEYAHLDQFLKDADKNAYNIINVLYRPVIREKIYKRWFTKKSDKKYLIKPYDKDKDVSIFESVPYEVYESALVFFYNLSKQLISATLNYMKEEEQHQTIKELDLARNGDGFRHSIRMLVQNELELEKLSKFLSINYYLD